MIINLLNFDKYKGFLKIGLLSINYDFRCYPWDLLSISYGKNNYFNLLKKELIIQIFGKRFYWPKIIQKKNRINC